MSFRQAVFERLVELGLTRPFAELSVEQDARFLDAHWEKGGAVQDAANSLFGPEIEPSADGYRDSVALFLEHYEIGTNHTEAILDANKDVLTKCHKAKMPPWAVAASLLHQAQRIPAYPDVQEDDHRIYVDLAENVEEMLKAAAGLQLLGENVHAVVNTLIHQGLLQLARDGLIKLPVPNSRAH